MTRHTPFELTPHGYVCFRVGDDETDEAVGTLEIRKDRIRWRPADKGIWLDLSWEEPVRQRVAVQSR